MNPLGFILSLIFALMIIISSKRVAGLALFAGCFFLSLSEQLNLIGFNLFAMRILGALAFLRVMGRGEFSFQRLNRLDKTFLVLHAYGSLVYCLRSKDGIAQAVATSLDVLFVYFAFRGFIANREELEAFLKRLIPLLIILALLVGVEMMTHNNPFSLVGGKNYAWMRKGRVRCFGPFQNPDLLGTVGGTFAMMYIAMAWNREHRKTACLGAGLCLFIVIATNSGGPIGATAAGLLALFVWPYRAKMQKFRRGVLAMVILCAIFMKAPIWYLPAKFSDLTGGDGWHRSYLMDVSFQHFGEWWLAGMPLELTADWFPYILSTTGSADICNQYVAYGIRAGLGMMVLLLNVKVRGYSIIVHSKKTIRSRIEWTSADEVMLWGLGSVLTVHLVNWFGITYFDQSYLIWGMQLAVISTVSQAIVDNPPQEDSLAASDAGADRPELVPLEYQPLN